MLKLSPELLVEQEIAELEAMVERLARSPRLSNLLRYIGEKHFAGESDQLREHNIATNVFGRPLTFDSGEDAIARVEVHRLRKKLTLYYESEGKDHQVRISIPPGSYVPVFRHSAEPVGIPATAAPPSEAALRSQTAPPLATPSVPPAKPAHRWAYISLLLGAALIALVAFRLTRPVPNIPNRSKALTSADPSIPAVTPLSGTGVHFLAGYTGQPHVDPSGVVWEPDRYFDRGGSWKGSRQFIARTNDPFMFEIVRSGEFSYNIPLNPGVYELHLFFVESGFGPGLGGGELSRVFHVIVNDVKLLPSFDIVSDAMGANIADERIFRDIQPAADGKLHISFEGQYGKPVVSAVEVVPGTPHKQNPIRMTTQPHDYIDRSGQVWQPDNYFLGGQSSLPKPPVAGAPDPGLFATERFGHFTYAIPVDVRGRYTLVLYFAEYYFGPQAPGVGGVGSRRFNVFCNGATLLEDFDIFKEAGSFHALTKTFHNLRPSPQGKLNLDFEPIANYANISAIEVLEDAR